MRLFCARAIPNLLFMLGAVEVDRIVDIRTLQLPVAMLIALCVVGMLIPNRERRFS